MILYWMSIAPVIPNNLKKLLFLIAFAFIILCVNAQTIKHIQRINDIFYEDYHALVNDTSIKSGLYIKKYKDYVIERGLFRNNKRFGKWAYFSLDGIFEFEYDHTNCKVVKISTKHNPEDYLETPIFFYGSPIIPYLYMVRNIVYRSEAKNKNITGRVSLAINIDKTGQITNFYIKEKLHPILDREVIRVAKTMPTDWQWIPATYHGQNISSEYLIDIEFELIDKGER